MTAQHVQGSTAITDALAGRTPPCAAAVAGARGSAAAFAVCIARTVRDGFNPTDEGLVVGYGRRLLDGDVPHRGFIFSRPATARPRRARTAS